MGNEKKAVHKSFQENLKTLQKCKNSRQTLYYSKGCNSFVGKTYVRLWGTLACACGEHLHVLVGNTCMCLWGTLACACGEHLHALVKMTRCAPRTTCHFQFFISAPRLFQVSLYYIEYNIKIYIHIHDSLLRTMKKQKWCVVRGALVCQIVKFCLAKEIMNVNLPLS